jgi:hypothetical protein
MEFQRTRNMRSRCRWLRELLRRDPTARTLANMSRLMGGMVGEGLIARSVAEGLLEGDAERLGLDPAAIGLWIGEGVEDARKAALARMVSGGAKADSGAHLGQTDNGDDSGVANNGGGGALRDAWAAIGHEQQRSK